MKKGVIAIVLCMMMLVSMVGCTNETAQNTEEKTAKAATTVTANSGGTAATNGTTEASTSGKVSGKKLGVTINGLDAQAARKLFEGTQEKAKAAGFDVMANNAGGTVGMADDVENFIEAGCNVIVLINADASTVSNAVKEASQKGIFVISDESGYMDGVSTVIGMNNFVVGAEMAMDVLSAIKYKGKIITTGHNDHPTIRGHYKVFDLVLAEYPDVQKVGTVYTKYPGTTEITYNGVSALLAKYSDISAVLCSQDLEALGVIQATKENGTYPNVKTTGIDGELDVLKDIANGGCVVSTYVFDTDAITNMIVQSSTTLCNGGSVPAFQEAPVTKVTKANVAKFIDEAEAAKTNK